MKPRSIIYKYYKNTEKDRHFKCKFCSEIISAPTTFNLINHYNRALIMQKSVNNMKKNGMIKMITYLPLKKNNRRD